MARAALDIAHTLLRRRKFAKAVMLLESNAYIYQNNFDFFCTLGTACLYLGDIGSARRYYEAAREIRISDTTLLLGQAALFLRKGETDRALLYYLQVLDMDPGNATAQKARNFIRREGTYENIQRWVDNRKIEAFYPPLGVNPDIIRNGVILGLLVGIVASLLMVFVFDVKLPERKTDLSLVGPRANLTVLDLTEEELKSPQDAASAGTGVRYVMSDGEITRTYRTALELYQQGRDNACQVEINRILGSNARLSVKQKVNVLKMRLARPVIGAVTDNYSYADVAVDPDLYLDCYVEWSGRVVNVRTQEVGYTADLLVSDETLRRVEGMVRFRFEEAPQPPIDEERSIHILGKINLDGGTLVLDAVDEYQPIEARSSYSN